MDWKKPFTCTLCDALIGFSAPAMHVCNERTDFCTELPDPIHTEQENPRGGRSPQVLYAVNTPSDFSVSAVARPYYGALFRKE